MMLGTLLFILLFLSPAAVVDHGIRLYEKGDFKRAADLFVQLKDSAPEDPVVRVWLGKSYLKIRDWDGAIREMEKAVQLNPSALNHLWLGRAYGAKASHVMFFSAPGWARRVLREFETAKQIAPENLDVRFDLLEFYLEAPGFIGGGREKANAAALEIAKLDPRQGFLARAAILNKEKKWDLSLKELTQATADFPESASAFKDLAEFLLERRDFKGALDAAKRAVALDSKSKGSQLLQAAAAIRLRTDLEYSERLLIGLASGPLTDDDPAFEEVYYWLGECYLAKGDKAKAREAFKSALSFNPDFDRAKVKF